MKMRKAVAAAVVVFFLVSLFAPGFCAFAMGERFFEVENEADFLKWYEDHKDSGGEFTLKGALRLSSGTAGEPIVFDGEGEIRIRCAGFSIDVISPVVFDNPNLTIVNNQGFSTVVVCDRDALLLLFQGNIVNTGGGIGVEFMEGSVITKREPGKNPDGNAGGQDVESEYASSSNASPSNADSYNATSSDTAPVKKSDSDTEGLDTFSIIVTADEEADDEACGIKFWGEGDITLSGLSIEVSGADSYGIQSQSAGITVEMSRIISEGRGIAYGVWSDRDVSASSSVIMAKGAVGAALHSRSGQAYINDCSVIQPESDLKSKYLMSGQPERLVPLAIKVSSKLEELEFPESVEVILKAPGDGGWITEEIQVKEWNLGDFVLDKAGKVTVEGVLDEASLALAEASNPSGRPVKQDVVKLGNTGTYISDLEYKPDGGEAALGTNVFLWCPYPYGADALYAEYSRDGEVWTTVEYEDGESNWMEDYFSSPNESHQFLMTFLVPYREGKFQLRLRTVGGGAYEGTGNPVILNMDNGEVTGLYDPGSADDGSGGDRGGTTVEPDVPLPDDKEEPDVPPPDGMEEPDVPLPDGMEEPTEVPKEEPAGKPKDELSEVPKDETTDNPGINGGTLDERNEGINITGDNSHEYGSALHTAISDAVPKETVMAQSGQTTGTGPGKTSKEATEAKAEEGAETEEGKHEEDTVRLGEEPDTTLPIVNGLAVAALVLAAAFGSFWFIGKLSGRLK